MKNFIIKHIQDGYAFLSTGEKIGIRKTEKGELYIRLKNTRSYRKDYTYTNLIKDAVEDVLLGYGDTIMSNEPSCFFNISVVHFLDEEIGKKYRESFIKDFKDATFIFQIKIANKFSLHNSFVLDGDVPVSFDSEQEANNFILQTMFAAKNLSERFDGLTVFEQDELIRKENIPFTTHFFANAIIKKYDNNFLQVVQNIKE